MFKRAPVGTWLSPQKTALFLGEIEKKLGFIDKSEWYRVSNRIVRTFSTRAYNNISKLRECGGSGCLSHFGTVNKMLRFAFPEYPWDETLFSIRRGSKKAQQGRVVRVTKEILPPNAVIKEEYLHPSLSWYDGSAGKGKNARMKIDVFLSDYNAAVEYQGEQHYHDLHSAFGHSNSIGAYQERDRLKLEECKRKGIHYIPVPYWWDLTKESLSTIFSEFKLSGLKNGVMY